MADVIVVVLLLVFIWAAVLLPPAAGARASREAEFLGSIRPDGPHDPGAPPRELDAFDQPRFRPALTANARRRQVLGGLVVAIGATLLLGLLPGFRLLLVVHLLLVNSCLVYVGLLVRVRDRLAAARILAAAPAAWRSEPVRRAPGFDEPVHPYATAYGSGASDGFAYADGGLGYGDEMSDRDEPAYAYASAGEDADGEWADGEWADGEWAQADESWNEEDEAVAAYLDEELALRRPA